ncbi:MAG: hypothetical protein WC819_00445 [Parcubacteria group bacterium]|jgi:hypothetical protein
MKKSFFVLFFLLNLLFSQVCVVTAEEIPLGKTGAFQINDETWRVHFKKMEGRVCRVDLQKIDGEAVVFSEPVTFDFAREERYIWKSGVKLTIFYVQKGVIVLVNGEEV